MVLPWHRASSPDAPDLSARHGAGTPRYAICGHVIGTLRVAGRRRSLTSTSIGYEEPIAGCTHTRVPDRRVGCAHGFLGSHGIAKKMSGASVDIEETGRPPLPACTNVPHRD